MARSFGKLWWSLFQDEHFCAQPILDKLLFTVLLGQQAFSYAGMSPIQLRKWAKGCRPASDLEIKAALIRLERNRYVFTDSETEEVLIRSFIRNDEVEKQPNLLISALSSAAEVESPKLAAVLLAELDRVTIPETSNEKLAKRMDKAFTTTRARLAGRAARGTQPFPEPFGEDFPEGLGDGFQRPAETEPLPKGLTEGLAEPPVVVAVEVLNSRYVVEDSRDQKPTSAKPPRPDDPPRDDVEALCTRLHDLVIAGGSKANISGKWRTEARLLLDRDERDFQKTLNLIEWSQQNPFWRKNILSMPKFREKYDQLRLAALAEHEQSRASPTGLSKREQKIAEGERFKPNPDPELLRRAGLSPGNELRVLPGGES